ncbi:MAG: hypothetical protein EZS28_040927 [Streblomastix strix]|uniref:Major facilitator superfamily (MFS) profile domain-containing protein n=1 Tax=Streblomastix strix TaxID=222440 RepID=A0A5J4TYG6_9EUKA|nr:MAG: hypothetical protein EZS28_040927 [Streblomastix strix]
MGALFVWESVDKEYLPAGALVMGLIGAILYGIGTCIFYVAYSLYMDSITNPKTRGILVGVFFGIFNFCAPVGNLLAGILNQTTLNQSIIQLIFAVIAFIGVIVLIPIKTGEMKEDRYLSFKPHFKEMFEIAKIPRYYAVALSSVFNMCMVNFLASVFTGQVPEDTARTFTGYAFAMAGVMQIIGSFTWGVIIDKKSKRASFFISALLIQLFIILWWVKQSQVNTRQTS